MFRRVFAIALNTYRESVRARILLGLTGVAVAVSIYSVVVGAYTLRDAARVVSDLGVASISLFSVIVAIVISSTSLHRELEQKTLFPILARPIRRSEYLVGKYLGTVLTIAVFVMADAGLVLVISAMVGGRPLWAVFPPTFLAISGFAFVAWRSRVVRTFGPIAFGVVILVAGTLLSSVVPTERRVVLASGALTMLEVLIVAAVATLFASFSSPFLSGLLTFGVFVVGREAEAFNLFPSKLYGQTVHRMAVMFGKVVPNLYVYVPPRPLLTGESATVPLGSYLGMASVAALGWAVGLLVLASASFKKRDFL